VVTGSDRMHTAQSVRTDCRVPELAQNQLLKRVKSQEIRALKPPKEKISG
jgi:hypothetical protein